MDQDQLALGALWYVVFLLSTTCHEAAHALVAKLGGDLTAFHGGQVSLHPLPHIRREPFGMVLFPILSFVTAGWMMGWASAPYDPQWSLRYPRRSAIMALAGPAANLTLALVAAVGIHLGLAFVFFRPPEFVRFAQIVQPASAGAAEAAAAVLSILFSLNILLAAFNLLPVPPLDGWSAAGLFLPEAAARRMKLWGFQAGAFSLLGLIVAWQLFGRIYPPIFHFSLRALYGSFF
ncbi:MAG: site-2 protease family protein [Bryobacteraceae bacterium]|nr:site-2 protease family protein [Bryobacteraceae bacterium]